MSNWLTASITGGTGNTQFTITASSSSELNTRIKSIQAQTTVQQKTATAWVKQRGAIQYDEPPEYITTYYYIDDTGTSLNPTETVVCGVYACSRPLRSGYFLALFRPDDGDWYSTISDGQSIGHGHIHNGKYRFETEGWHKIEWQVGFKSTGSTRETIVTDRVPSDSFAYAQMTAILFPDAIETIGARVCTNKGQTYYPDDMKLNYIYYPSGLTYVGDYAFANTKIQNPIVKSGVTYGEGVYQNCTGITSIIIENGVTEIAERMFCLCCNLDIGSIVWPNSLLSINDRAFRQLANPPYSSGYTGQPFNLTLPQNLKSVGEEAFRETKIINLTIPNSLEKIGRGAFEYSGIYQINIDPYMSNMKVFSDSSFSYCNITSFVFPYGYTNEIDGYYGHVNAAFGGNTNLSSIYAYMPDVSNIDNGSTKFPHGVAQTGVFHYPAGADYSNWLNGDWPTNPNWTFVADL